MLCPRPVGDQRSAWTSGIACPYLESSPASRIVPSRHPAPKIPFRTGISASWLKPDPRSRNNGNSHRLLSLSVSQAEGFQTGGFQ